MSLGSIVLAVSVTEDYKEKGATLGVVVWFLVVLVQSGFFVGCHHCIEGGGGGRHPWRGTTPPEAAVQGVFLTCGVFLERER